MTPVNSSGLELLAILIGQDKLLVAVIDVVQDVLRTSWIVTAIGVELIDM